MIGISEYIDESLGDNIVWKTETYFRGNREEKREFLSLIWWCKKKSSTDKKQIEEWASAHKMRWLKPYIDFVNDVVSKEASSQDYMYQLSIIIKDILSSKTIKWDKFIKKD